MGVPGRGVQETPLQLHSERREGEAVYEGGKIGVTDFFSPFSFWATIKREAFLLMKAACMSVQVCVIGRITDC